MRNTIQTLTLGLALTAAGFAGAAFVSQAGADREVAPFERGMAFVDVFGLIDEIVKGEEYEAARTAFDAEQQETLSSMQTRMQELQAQLQVSQPGSPEAQGVQQQGAQLQQQMQQFYQSYQSGLERLVGQQIADAYQLIYAAASEIATQQSVDFLFVSRPDEDLLVDSLSGVAQEILARPLIAPSAAVDLTASVRERLGLPEPSEAEDQAETEAQSPTEPAAQEPAGGSGTEGDPEDG
ncbi:MAG: OmpH family outer membrane protein [Planctomycetota bacterium]